MKTYFCRVHREHGTYTAVLAEGPSQAATKYVADTNRHVCTVEVVHAYQRYKFECKLRWLPEVSVRLVRD